MSFQDILGVAISLIFVWLVMSTAASAFQEWICTLLAWRATDLQDAIRQMLASDELTAAFYQHPLIANLYRPSKKAGKSPRLPSYIPGNKFALALLDLVSQVGLAASPIGELTAQINAQLEVLDNPDLKKLAQNDWKGVIQTADQIAGSPNPESALDSLREQITAYGGKYPEVQPVLDALMPQLSDYYQQYLAELRAAPTNDTTQQNSMRAMRMGVASLGTKSPDLKDSLAAVMRSAEAYAGEAEQTIATTRIGIETWFNDSMDRLSGTYKRRAQVVAFLIGLVLAVVLNVDSIYVATTLWTQSTLRQGLVAEAQAYANQNSAVQTVSGPSAAIQSIQDLSFPFGWSLATYDTQGRACTIFPFIPGYAWGVPGHDSLGHPTCGRLGNLPADLMAWLTKLLGFIITAAATAQGAPFWFDLLKKAVNMRSSGTNPDEKLPVG